jgi:hypothetical protein
MNLVFWVLNMQVPVHTLEKKNRINLKKWNDG